MKTAQLRSEKKEIRHLMDGSGRKKGGIKAGWMISGGKQMCLFFIL